MGIDETAKIYYNVFKPNYANILIEIYHRLLIGLY